MAGYLSELKTNSKTKLLNLIETFIVQNTDVEMVQ